MVTVWSIRARAGSEPITMFTTYDAPTTGVVDEAGIDIVLIGDSMGNTALGYDLTLPVTVEDVASRTAAMARVTDDVLVVAGIPFPSVGVDEASNVEHCGRMFKKADADAVELEYGPHTVELTEHLVQLGVPVVAHLGLTPQCVEEVGYGRQGIDHGDAQKILDLVKARAGAGAFSFVLEHVPANLAKQVTETIDIPTAGTGADPDCDGQMLVVNGVVGMSDRTPPLAAQFDDVKSEMEEAVGTYRDAVKTNEFPADEHSHVEDDLDELH